MLIKKISVAAFSLALVAFASGAVSAGTAHANSNNDWNRNGDWNHDWNNNDWNNNDWSHRDTTTIIPVPTAVPAYAPVPGQQGLPYPPMPNVGYGQMPQMPNTGYGQMPQMPMPGLPNTGAGGNAAANFSMLLASGFAVLAGGYYIISRRQQQFAQ